MLRRSKVVVFGIAVVCSTIELPVGAHNTIFRSQAAPAVNDSATSQAETAATSGSTDNTANGLPTGWHGSSDVIYMARSDDNGYHLWRARAAERWEPRPLATVRPAGLADGERWIGFHCLVGDGSTIVAVVAQWSAVNNAAMRDRGGLAYAIDTSSGDVRALRAGVAVKYHTPGCGSRTSVALLAHEGQDQEATTVEVVDVITGASQSRHHAVGQLTSAVPTRGGVVAARDTALVLIAEGAEQVIARTNGTPFNLQVGPEDRVDFLVADRHSTTIQSLIGESTRRVGSAPLGNVRLHRGDDATIAVGQAQIVPNSGLRSIESTNAQAVASVSRRAGIEAGLVVTRPPRDADAPHELLLARADTGEVVGSLQAVDAGGGPASLPEGIAPNRPSEDAVGNSTMSATTPTCAVPRNDVRRQVPQPNADQVDWAIQQATRNLLKGAVLTRPAGYANLGLASYQPSSDFPRRQLSGAVASVPVPPSVIQAVFAQESNWKQATWRALPGVSGNPLVADYYGAGGTLDTIDYPNADCGYGLGQVTDPMRTTSTAYSTNGKTKVAVDYAENTAAAIQFLVDKWNQLYGEGVLLNNGDPSILENWYGAIWAYNTGWNQPDSAGREGLGWTNNPMNADYPPDRDGFLRATYADAEHPSDWPYQERVFGWMETPQLTFEGDTSYAPPVYAGQQQLHIPPRATFCVPTINSCDPNHQNGKLSYCTLENRHCWWNEPVTWADCPANCATSSFTVSTTAIEPAWSNFYPPNCDDHPASPDPLRTVVIVDEQASNYNVEGCSASWTSSGSFSVAYGTSSSGDPLGAIDWHQLGTGFGGHIWFTKNRAASDTAHVNVGTWTPSLPAPGTYSVQAHIPPSGASTAGATYRIHLGDGTIQESTIDQHLHENRWVPLGTFNLQPGAKVELSNVTAEATPGIVNVAYDAIAFVPMLGTARSTTFEAAAIFSENQNLDTSDSFMVDTAFDTEAETIEWARRIIHGDSTNPGVLDYPVCITGPSAACVRNGTRSVFSSWDLAMASQSPAQWMHYSNSAPPKVITGSHFDDLETHKLRSKLTIDYRVGTTGSIISGSGVVRAVQETGHTHMPDWLWEFMKALDADYGIEPPDLRYNVLNLNGYTHTTTTHDPMVDGIVPGRAYRPYTKSPVYASGCMDLRSVSGGVIGWKPFLNEGAVTGSVAGWKERVEDTSDAGQLPEALAFAADRMYKSLFSNQYDWGWTGIEYAGSPYRWAPPLWIEQMFRLCGDGTVRPLDAAIAMGSYMPDLYLYVDGRNVDIEGIPQGFVLPSENAVRVLAGEFDRFSKNPAVDANGPWSGCPVKPEWPRPGNPWNMTITEKEDKGDDVRLCSTGEHFDHGTST